MIKVVAHFLDGRLIKGETFDLPLNRSTCLIHTVDRESLTVRLSELKGLFVVKDLAGKRDHHERTTVESADPRGRGGRWLEMKFLDGEVLVGLSTNYSEGFPFFVVVPADLNSNNARIFVNRSALESLRTV